MVLFAQPIHSTWVMTVLSITVLIAAWTDWQSWRIPNALVAASMAAALMHAAFAKDGIGVTSCLIGGCVGLGLFLPLYFLKGMAAGDVKLLAAIGMHVGPSMVVDIALLTCLIGGVWAMALMDLRRGTGPVSWLFVNLRMIRAPAARAGSEVDAQAQPVKDRLQMIPYGVVMALGTIGAIGLAQT